jgi:hypothetical protein
LGATCFGSCHGSKKNVPEIANGFFLKECRLSLDLIMLAASLAGPGLAIGFSLLRWLIQSIAAKQVAHYALQDNLVAERLEYLSKNAQAHIGVLEHLVKVPVKQPYGGMYNVHRARKDKELRIIIDDIDDYSAQKHPNAKDWLSRQPIFHFPLLLLHPHG